MEETISETENKLDAPDQNNQDIFCEDKNASEKRTQIQEYLQASRDIYFSWLTSVWQRHCQLTQDQQISAALSSEDPRYPRSVNIHPNTAFPFSGSCSTPDCILPQVQNPLQLQHIFSLSNLGSLHSYAKESVSMHQLPDLQVGMKPVGASDHQENIHLQRSYIKFGMNFANRDTVFVSLSVFLHVSELAHVFASFVILSAETHFAHDLFRWRPPECATGSWISVRLCESCQCVRFNWCRITQPKEFGFSQPISGCTTSAMSSYSGTIGFIELQLPTSTSWLKAHIYKFLACFLYDRIPINTSH